MLGTGLEYIHQERRGTGCLVCISFLPLLTRLWLNLCLDSPRRKWRSPKIFVCVCVFFSFSLKYDTCRKVYILSVPLIKSLQTEHTSVTSTLIKKQNMTSAPENLCVFPHPVTSHLMHTRPSVLTSNSIG